MTHIIPTITFTAAILVAPAALAQEAQPAPADQPPVTREGVADPVEAFLSRKGQAQSARSRALTSRGRGSNLGQLTALAQAARIAPPGLGRNAAERLRLESSLSTDVLQLLLALGFNPGEVRRLRTAGVDPFEAGSALVRGIATPFQQAVLSKSVVVADVVSNEVGGPNDGFGSTLTLSVIETLKGRHEAGDRIRLRQRSGAASDYSSDLSGETGTRYLLFLSDDLYQQESTEEGRRPGDDFMVQLASAYRLDGDVVTGTASGQPRGVGVAELRQSLVPLQQGAAW